MKQSYDESQLIKEENEKLETARERFFFVFILAIFVITIIYSVIKFVIVPVIKHLF